MWAPPARTLVFLAVSLPALAMMAASLAYPLLHDGSAVVLGRFLDGTCHRLPGRCLQLPWGTSGLCARCTAFWAGLGLSAAIIGASSRTVGNPLHGFLLIAPMAVDGLMQQAGLYESVNPVRVVTGLAGGWGTGLMILWLIQAISCAAASPGPRGRERG